MAEKKLKRPARNSTVNENEIRQFDVLGDKWWDETGPMKPLHRLNPVRLEYIRNKVCEHYERPAERLRALQGLTMADIGCGGGLVTEPLCRMGAEVTGIDAGAENIRAAKTHARAHNLDIDYQATTAESVAESGRTFDVVTALEIIEHVEDIDLFVESSAALVKKGGMIVFSTLNRTPKSYLLGIVAAEHILRWLPRGTHSWKKFVKPSEIARRLENHGFTVTDVQGLVFNPLTGKFSMSASDLDVNYFLTAIKK